MKKKVGTHAPYVRYALCENEFDNQTTTVSPAGTQQMLPTTRIINNFYLSFTFTQLFRFRLRYSDKNSF